MEAAGTFLFFVVVIAAQKAAGADDIPYFSQGVVGVAVMGSLFMLWRFQRSLIGPLEHRATTSDQALHDEREERRECEWRLGQLVEWLRDEEGMAVPDRIVYGRPPWARPREAP